MAILKQEMLTAAREERFKEAAQFRDRLETLNLKQRCMQVEHREGLRGSICHRIGMQTSRGMSLSLQSLLPSFELS